MNRSLAPLTRTRTLGAAEVSFPLRLRAEAATSALVSAPRRAVGGLLGTRRLRPVPLGPRSGGILVQHTTWSDTPVGAFSEVLLLALAYLGRGSPVPALAPLLHGMLDRNQAVGDFGFVPVIAMVDTHEAVTFRRDLWHVATYAAPIRYVRSPRATVVQVDHLGDPLVRLAVPGGPRPSSGKRSSSLPLFGHHEGVLWCDVGASTSEHSTRRYRPSGGHFAISAVGPLVDLAYTLGPGDDGEVSRRLLSTEVTTSATVRWQGPRPVDPDAVDLTGPLATPEPDDLRR